MYPSVEAMPLLTAPHQAIVPIGVPAASAGYAFLSKPPKPKHKPQPISTRCVPARPPSRSTPPRRRGSISGSPAIQTSFLSFTPTPPLDTPRTPHLTSYGYTTAFTNFPRRGSIPDCQVRRAPISPKRVSPSKSAPNSPKRLHASGSPRRRHDFTSSPSSPFAPPSPSRTRARVESFTRTAVAVPPPPFATATPKLSKIRSFTNLRARSPSPGPRISTSASKPVMNALTTPKITTKRAKRSATPARGSAAFTKYRPMPFVQQMQMIQFLEGGTLESHIRRHHVHAGQGTSHTGFAIDRNQDVAHGYAFTDERGMIWFDEEEEWEFACLLPKATRPPRRRGIKRLLGRRREDDCEDDWEEFGTEEEDGEDGDVDPVGLLVREDDELRAYEDDLASFGGALESTWARGHPVQSVLNLPDPKVERKSKRVGRTAFSTPAPVPASSSKQTPNPSERSSRPKSEFFASAFVPHVHAPTRAPPTPSAPLHRATSPFRMFQRTTASTDKDTVRTIFQRHKRSARSVPNVGAVAEGRPSFASLGTSLRGGDVLDAPTDSETHHLASVGWEIADDECNSRASSSSVAPADVDILPSSSSRPDVHSRSVSPPPAAARRLGIGASTSVSLDPLTFIAKKQGFRSLRGFKSSRND